MGVCTTEGSGGLRLWKGELMALMEPMELKSGRSGSERLWIRSCQTHHVRRTAAGMAGPAGGGRADLT